jgi:hypothetical protein
MNIRNVVETYTPLGRLNQGPLTWGNGSQPATRENTGSRPETLPVALNQLDRLLAPPSDPDEPLATLNAAQDLTLAAASSLSQTNLSHMAGIHDLSGIHLLPHRYV